MKIPTKTCYFARKSNNLDTLLEEKTNHDARLPVEPKYEEPNRNPTEQQERKGQLKNSQSTKSSVRFEMSTRN